MSCQGHYVIEPSELVSARKSHEQEHTHTHWGQTEELPILKLFRLLGLGLSGDMTNPKQEFFDFGPSQLSYRIFPSILLDFFLGKTPVIEGKIWYLPGKLL